MIRQRTIAEAWLTVVFNQRATRNVGFSIRKKAENRRYKDRALSILVLHHMITDQTNSKGQWTHIGTLWNETLIKDNICVTGRPSIRHQRGALSAELYEVYIDRIWGDLSNFRCIVARTCSPLLFRSRPMLLWCKSCCIMPTLSGEEQNTGSEVHCCAIRHNSNDEFEVQANVQSRGAGDPQ